MFKLTVVHGPGKGTTLKLEPGEKTIGRAPGNDFILGSSQVSKRHCSLYITETEVILTDLGSANGTFVNGVLIKKKTLNSGDRITMGDCVVELTSMQLPKNVIPIRGVPVSGGHINSGSDFNLGLDLGLPPGVLGQTNSGLKGGTSVGIANQAKIIEQKSLKDKIREGFENYVLNFLYNLNEKQEWKSLLTFVFVFFCLTASIAAVYPVIDRSMAKLEHEAKERAAFLSRQIVDRNSGYIYDKLETKVDVGFAEKEKGVLGAYVVDLEGRVISPPRLANQYLRETDDAAFVAYARTLFAKKEKLEEVTKIFGKSVYVATPLRVFSPGDGKNVAVAMGIVNFDREALQFDDGTVALTYIQAIILVAILSVIVFVTIYRLTLKPLQYLNIEVDSVLKGNSSAINRRYKMQEIDALIDIVNVTLQRAANGGGQGASSPDSISSEDVLNLSKFFGDHSGSTGLLILSSDKQVMHINSAMEEISGIRYAMAAGAEFSSVARDEAFNAFINDVVSRVMPGGSVINEEFEFSGVNYKMGCVAVGAAGFTKFYVVTATKPE